MCDRQTDGRTDGRKEVFLELLGQLKMKEIWKVVQKLSREQDSAVGGGGGVQTGTKT